MIQHLPPGRVRRTIVLTCCLALVAQGLSEVVLTVIKIAKEVFTLLPLLGP